MVGGQIIVISDMLCSLRVWITKVTLLLVSVDYINKYTYKPVYLCFSTRTHPKTKRLIPYFCFRVSWHSLVLRAVETVSWICLIYWTLRLTQQSWQLYFQPVMRPFVGLLSLYQGSARWDYCMIGSQLDYGRLEIIGFPCKCTLPKIKNIYCKLWVDGYSVGKKGQ